MFHKSLCIYIPNILFKEYICGHALGVNNDFVYMEVLNM